MDALTPPLENHLQSLAETVRLLLARLEKGKEAGSAEKGTRPAEGYTKSSQDSFNQRTAYLNQSEYDRAIANYTEAVRLDPKNAMAYMKRAETYRFKNDFDRTIADSTEAIKLDPQLALAYYNRGEA